MPLSIACTADERRSAMTLTPAATPPTANTAQPDKSDVSKLATNNLMVSEFCMYRLSKNGGGS
jgi:hypothetical protein